MGSTSRRHWLIVGCLVGLAGGCGQPAPDAGDAPAEPAGSETAPVAALPAAPEEPAVRSNPLRDVFFGDTHIHTILSFDAYLMGTRNTPDDAYEFAKGAAIEHASGFRMQMKKPLDFLAVSDHAFYLGMMREISEGRIEHGLSDVVKGAVNPAGSQAAFAAAISHVAGITQARVDDPGVIDDLDDRAVARSAWQEIIEAAERHNDPGNFTTFIGYEYTAFRTRSSENLHRNVMFQRLGLCRSCHSARLRLHLILKTSGTGWMRAAREQGMDAVAIPHNSNGSNGWMFQITNWDGRTHRCGLRGSAYAQRADRRKHSGKRNVRHTPAAFAERRVGGLRDHAASEWRAQLQSQAPRAATYGRLI